MNLSISFITNHDNSEELDGIGYLTLICIYDLDSSLKPSRQYFTTIKIPQSS